MVNSALDLCAPGVFRLRTLMVNVFFVAGESGSWVLVDTGMRGYAGSIARAARAQFGPRGPSAIVLTHAHFDHIGGLPRLADEWGVPVYVHPLESPYVTGRSSYPPPDPTVGGGAWSMLSVLFPRGPIDLGVRAAMLPADRSVPALAGWQWVHTPGHTAGHVSLFRERDRTLIAGDAVVTTRQESLTYVATQRAEVWRPPAYFTGDWVEAARSVRELAALNPDVLATGHGPTLRGPAMRAELHDLAEHFDAYRPAHGRYVRQPAIADERGVVRVPPRRGVSPALVVGAVGLAAGVALMAAANARGRRG